MAFSEQMEVGIMNDLFEKGVESRIKEITVYRGGAFITRVANVQLEKGRNTVVLNKLSASIKRESIQVGVANSVSCLQVSYVPNHNEYKVDGKVDIVNTEIDEQLCDIRKKLKVVDLQLEMINTIDVKYNINDDIDKIKNYTEYSSKQLEELITRQSALQRKLEILEKKKTAEKSVRSLGIWKLRPGVIELELDSELEQETEIELQYFDWSAGWKPNYDIRMNDSKKTISFILKGNITQNTGESWIDTDISVSTGDYSQRRYCGELPVWNVRKDYVGHRGSKITRASRESFMDGIIGQIDLKSTDSDEYYDDDDMIQTKELTIPSFLAMSTKVRSSTSGHDINKYETDTSDNIVIDNQNSVIYKLAEKCSVYNDKGSGTVTIIKHEIDCDIDIYTTPKLDCTAFMIAKVKNFAKYSFLECDANIFFNNRFVGQTRINPESEDDTMLVSLGQDNNIIVKRVVERDYLAKSFIAGAQTKEELYAIKLANNKPIDAHMIVVDQIPISADSKVVVETTKLSGGVVEETTGKVTWEFDLKPDEEKEIRLGFKIVYKR